VAAATKTGKGSYEIPVQKLGSEGQSDAMNEKRSCAGESGAAAKTSYAGGLKVHAHTESFETRTQTTFLRPFEGVFIVLASINNVKHYQATP
jgi:hypothetical protein